MKKVNELVLCKDNYDDLYDFESAIQNAIMLLLNAGYIMTVRYDEPSLGIVVIEYEHGDLSYGCPHPCWLSPTEYESVVWDNEQVN